MEKKKKSRRGLSFRRRFTEIGVDPFDLIPWEKRAARITNEKNEVIFEQGGVDVPKKWSRFAVNVVVSRYFRGTLGSPERERSVRDMISRVTKTIADWGQEDGYFASSEDHTIFEAELNHLLIHQMASFNSPVWFNVGFENEPQCSACFINSINDSMDSILELAQIEARLFSGGSGTGTNVSPLRASNEPLSGGGTASGPVSFMRGFDSFASIMKFGGRTRKASKTVHLDIDHPDILEFIWCRAKEEQKAWALIDAGYDGTATGEAYDSVAFQNTETTVRISDAFMDAVENDRRWSTFSRQNGEKHSSFPAREIFREIAESIHQSGYPTIQFDSLINDWHTCSNSGRINASNPCAEYMFLDNTACNLASLNLMAFVDEEAEFDLGSFRHAIDVMVTALEIIIDHGGYPTDEIKHNSHIFRPLGLGFANLGALLTARGLPYDSEGGRAFASTIASLMTAEAYAQSARMAERFGPFAKFEANRKPFCEVIDRHIEATDQLENNEIPTALLAAAKQIWDFVREKVNESGARNAQVTALAPTGTISFMMDCESAGIEPNVSLIAYRRVKGGDMIKVVNRTVPMGLKSLGYEKSQSKQIVEYIEEHSTIEGAPGMRQRHLSVFDCTMRSHSGRRSISPEGHLKLVAALQPFITGSISKTVHVPNQTTAEEIGEWITQAHQSGIKAVSIQRDGSKRTLPLAIEEEPQEELAPVGRPRRKRLPDDRDGVTHKFSIAGHKGYLTIGLYEDGTPGEIFIRMAKAGSVVAGLMDSFALAISLALQYGVPLHVLVDKYSHSRFEPSGFTTNPQIPIAKSIMDYIFRWLGMKYVEEESEIPMEELDQESPKLLSEPPEPI